MDVVQGPTIGRISVQRRRRGKLDRPMRDLCGPGLLSCLPYRGVPSLAQLLSLPSVPAQSRCSSIHTFTELTSAPRQRSPHQAAPLTNYPIRQMLHHLRHLPQQEPIPIPISSLQASREHQTHRISACTELPANNPAPGSGIHFLTYSATILVTSSGLCGLLRHAVVRPVLPCCSVHHSPILINPNTSSARTGCS